MTKPVTSVAAMMLYEEGAFELSDPIAQVAARVRRHPRLRRRLGDEAGHRAADRADPGLAPAHPHVGAHLRLPPRAPGRRDVPRDGPRVGHAARRRLRRGAAASGPRRRWCSSPAASWNYGVSTDVLGRLVEVISGQPLDEFFEQRIFAPLGMRDTSFGLRPDDDPTSLARLYLATPGQPGGPSSGMMFSEAFDAAAHTQARVPVRRRRAGVDGRRLPALRRAAAPRRRPTTAARLLGPRTIAHMVRNHLPGNQDLESFGRPLFAETPLRGVGFGLGFSMVIDPAPLRRRRQPRRLQLGRRGVHGVLRRPGRGRDRQLLHAAAAVEHPADPQLPARPGQPGPRRLSVRLGPGPVCRAEIGTWG